jgi:chaperonin GroES
MNPRPLGDGVLVRLAQAPEKSAGGIIIPENVKEKPRRGKVLAVGPGREQVCSDGSFATLAPRIAVGDVVLFGQYAGTKLDDDLLLLRESDLLAVDAS